MKIQASEAFDTEFIVIGSGPAGVSAAIALVEAGRRVLMIDGAGPQSSPEWGMALRPDNGLSPKLRTPAALSIIEPFRDWLNVTEDGFHAVGSLARGGLARIWGGFVSEFDEGDLEGWPITVHDLRPSYRAVGDRTGISGSADDDMAAFFGLSGRLLPPPPIGPTAALLRERYRQGSRAAGFALGLARNALLTVDHAGRQACDLSLSCLWGCSRGAIYDASGDVAQLCRSPNFRIIEHAMARRLASVSNGWEVTLRGSESRMRARRIVVAAGCLGTLRLVLPLLRSSEPGRLRLLNSPVMVTPILVPRRLGCAAPNQGYTIAQLGFCYRYGTAATDYATGGLYEVAALPPSSFAVRLPLGRRAATETFRAFAPALAVATTYFPGTCSANEIHWRRDGEDIAVKICGRTAPGFDAMAVKVQRSLARIWRRLGGFVLSGGELAKPGTDAHLGGIFPMGSTERYGTTALGELNEAPGLHLVDGSVLPTVPSKFTTLTIMANADRIGRVLSQSTLVPS